MHSKEGESVPCDHMKSPKQATSDEESLKSTQFGDA